MHEITRTVVVDHRTHALRMKRFLLTIDEPTGPTRHRVFGRRRITIGASPDNDVALDDPAVSRAHCEIRVDDSGYRLVDLESKNGTRIGDLRVTDAYLYHGAVIAIGDSTIRFETTDEDVEVLVSGRSRFGALLGSSTAMREVFAVLERVALTDARLLLLGPPGVGKEQAAEAVHKHSARRGGEFHILDCAAVGHHAVEGELFGDDARGEVGGGGALDAAASGTLCLVDPAELPADVQARLARALDRGEFRRNNGTRAQPLRARIVSTSERGLRREVERGNFREDLYYLLSVVEVTLPPLHERPEDIPLLVEHFLEARRRESGNDTLNITYATMEKLKRYAWPGNVAELRNFIDRAVALASVDGAAADPRFLAAPAPRDAEDEPARAVDALMRASGVDVSLPFKDAKSRLVEAFELEYWRRLLERTAGNVSAAARVAGVHRKSLEYILKKHEIDAKDIAP